MKNEPNEFKIRALFPAAGWRVVILLAAASQVVSAATLFTFGADSFGAPTSLNSMDPTSGASVTNVQTPVGDGSIGFNGGLLYSGGLLYAVGNDSSGNASLYSFGTNGLGLTDVSSDFNDAGDGTGFVFSNGLAAVGNTFYAIGAGPSGEDLFQIGNGTTTLIRAVDTLNGTYGGLAYDPTLGVFYGLIANASGGDYLVSFGLTGATIIVANLTSLDGAVIGTHLDGLADAGDGILYDIYINPNTFTGQLEQISVSGPSTVTLYDTQIPLAQDAGIAIVTPTPEPGMVAAVGAGLLMLGFWKKREQVYAFLKGGQND